MATRVVSGLAKPGRGMKVQYSLGSAGFTSSRPRAGLWVTATLRTGRFNRRL